MPSPFDRFPWYFVDFEMRISDPRLVELHRYWLSLGEAGELPGAERFDPLDLPRLLGDLFVVRVERDPHEPATVTLRYSLIGTRLVEALGRDATGRTVAETYPSEHPVNGVYQYMIERRAPVRAHGRLDWVGKDYRRFEGIVMPLGDAEGRVAKFVGASVYG